MLQVESQTTELTEGSNSIQSTQPADSTTSKTPESCPSKPAQTMPDTRKEQHEEYVPLSAEEMLAQSFADPKVPWSTDGSKPSDSKPTTEGSGNELPGISYAHAPYATCVTSRGSPSLLSTCRNVMMRSAGGSTPPPPSKRWNWRNSNQTRGMYSWQNNSMGSQELNNGVISDQKPIWKP